MGEVTGFKANSLGVHLYPMLYVSGYAYSESAAPAAPSPSAQAAVVVPCQPSPQRYEVATETAVRRSAEPEVDRTRGGLRSRPLACRAVARGRAHGCARSS